MKKFFNRKTTATVAVLVLIVVLNVVMLCLPAFGAYKGSVKSDGGTTYTYTLEYKGNDEIKYTSSYKNGSNKTETTDTLKVKYNATDKVWETESLAVKVSERKSVFTHTYYTLLNGEVKITSTLAIVVQVVFALGYVACTALLVLNAKGGKKGKKRSRR